MAAIATQAEAVNTQQTQLPPLPVAIAAAGSLKGRQSVRRHQWSTQCASLLYSSSWFDSLTSGYSSKITWSFLVTAWKWGVRGHNPDFGFGLIVTRGYEAAYTRSKQAYTWGNHLKLAKSVKLGPSNPTLSYSDPSHASMGCGETCDTIKNAHHASWRYNSL